MTELTGDEWECRFKERIVQKLTAGLSSNWTITRAREAAQAEFDAIHDEGIDPCFENDPEGNADDALAAWEE